MSRNSIDNDRFKGGSKEQGLGLVSAIFVITILAVIIAGMSRFFVFSQNVTTQDFLAARALTAAQAGVELELTCLRNNLVGCAVSAAVGAPVPAVKDSWPAGGGNFDIAGLRGCRAETFFRSVSSAQGNFRTVDSTGICGGAGLNGAQRRVIVRAQ